MRKTKIIATIGPASRDPEILEQLILAGMDCARLNFSHGTLEEHAEVIRSVRQLSAKHNRKVAILQDLGGIKLRLGYLEEPMQLNHGDEVLIVPDERSSASDVIPFPEPTVIKNLRPGNLIFISDGIICLEVLETDGIEVKARVRNGGIISSYKGLNLPGVTIDHPVVTEEDKVALQFGVEQNVDWVGISFVRTLEDMRYAKAYLNNIGSKALVMAKLERSEGIENIDAILQEVDGIMVARGDLGVEIPMERVPIVQKEIVRKAGEAAKPSCIATQMLRSMLVSPIPSRAEVSDISNAVLDGCDSILLSDEIAVGEYPVEAVRVADVTIRESEKIYPYYRDLPAKDRTQAIAASASRLTKALDSKPIVVTSSGRAAFEVSRFRPENDIIVFLAPGVGAAAVGPGLGSGSCWDHPSGTGRGQAGFHVNQGVAIYRTGGRFRRGHNSPWVHDRGLRHYQHPASPGRGGIPEPGGPRNGCTDVGSPIMASLLRWPGLGGFRRGALAALVLLVLTACVQVAPTPTATPTPTPTPTLTPTPTPTPTPMPSSLAGPTILVEFEAGFDPNPDPKRLLRLMRLLSLVPDGVASVGVVDFQELEEGSALDQSLDPRRLGIPGPVLPLISASLDQLLVATSDEGNSRFLIFDGAVDAAGLVRLASGFGISFQTEPEVYRGRQVWKGQAFGLVTFALADTNEGVVVLSQGVPGAVNGPDALVKRVLDATEGPYLVLLGPEDAIGLVNSLPSGLVTLLGQGCVDLSDLVGLAALNGCTATAATISSTNADQLVAHFLISFSNEMEAGKAVIVLKDSILETELQLTEVSIRQEVARVRIRAIGDAEEVLGALTNSLSN